MDYFLLLPSCFSQCHQNKECRVLLQQTSNKWSTGNCPKQGNETGRRQKRKKNDSKCNMHFSKCLHYAYGWWTVLPLFASYLGLIWDPQMSVGKARTQKWERVSKIVWAFQTEIWEEKQVYDTLDSDFYCIPIWFWLWTDSRRATVYFKCMFIYEMSHPMSEFRSVAEPEIETRSPGKPVYFLILRLTYYVVIN